MSQARSKGGERRSGFKACTDWVKPGEYLPAIRRECKQLLPPFETNH